MSYYYRIISRLNYGAFLALLASLPYPLPVIRICWLVWTFSWLMELRFLKRENIRPHRGMVYLSAGLGVWVLWNIISLLWADNTQAGLNDLTRYISLLALPLAGIFGFNRHYDIRQCLRIFVISCAASVLVYAFTHYWVFNYRGAMDKYYTDIVNIDWLHMNQLLLSIKHRLHYTNLLCMAFPCLFILYRKNEWWKSAAVSILLLAGIWFSGSRAALINLQLVLLISLYWFYLRSRTLRTQLLSFSAVLILAAGCTTAALFLHPRNEIQDIRRTLIVDAQQEEPAVEPRAAIWKAALENPKDYIAYGVGTGNSSDYMMHCYEAHGWTRYFQSHYSVHNQFLAVCIELGAVAALLFLLFWLAVPRFFTGGQRYWMLCTTAICLTAMLTDLFLGGLEGIIFLVVMSVMALLLPVSLQPDTQGE